MTEGTLDRSFGRYRVIERLGVGAMGTVYRARDDSLGRDVAVKTTHTVGRSDFQSEMFQARFDHEARAVAALSHPNIVEVFDVGIEDGTPFLVMELVEGPSLAQRLERLPRLDPATACTLGRQLAGALDAAHARGIVHRDVKPGNILEAGAGVWKLADFGVAHVPDSSLTWTGQFVGSPAYAAPEALQRGELGPASDVYSLGATLYEALAGTPPYGPRGQLTEGALASGAAPQPIGELCPDAPHHLAQAIMGAIDREPSRRLTAVQLAEALGGRPTPLQPRSRRRAAAVALAFATLVVGIALGAGLSSDESPTPPSAMPAPFYAPAEAAEPGTRFHRRGGPPSDKVIRKNAKQWSKVNKKLRDGKHRKALKHLDEILRRDPYDARALSLYRRLTGVEWTGDRHDD